MGDTHSSPPGLLQNLRSAADTLLAALQTRVELFGVELREERCRLVRLFALVSTALFFGMLAVAGVTACVLWALPEGWRWPGLALFSGMNVLATLALLWRVRSALNQAAQPFSESINQLQKDRQCLSGATPNN